MRCLRHRLPPTFCIQNRPETHRFLLPTAIRQSFRCGFGLVESLKISCSAVFLNRSLAVIAWLVGALFCSAPIARAFEANTPVTPGSSPEAQSLLAYFASIYGTKVISGQHDGWRMTNGMSEELNYITNTTGKLPALLEMDVSGLTAHRDSRHRLAEHAIEWFNQRHGLVGFCWHWRAPMDAPAFYTKDTKFDIARAVMPGTPEYAATERDLDTIAGELEILRDAHVPVLWRPLHEANGRWFWWGAGGPEPFKKLWRMEFENFTVKHHLNNLIWVFSPGAETDLAAWYPGDAYVDIIGQDHYPMDGNHGAAKDVFDELTFMTRGQKLIALGENGPIPDPALMAREKAGWLYFTTWSGSILLEKTTPEELRAYYNNPYVLTLGDLPDVRHFPVAPPGQPVKLGFAGAPGEVAINGTRRMPLEVAVEDQKGKTVRDGTYSVTLALKKTGGAECSGILTTNTVNGLATFSDVEVNRAGQFKLIATATGLRAATSPAFRVGPGNGLRRQWWTNDVAFLGPPAGMAILGQTLELPVAQATNYSTRITGLLLAPQTGKYQFWLAGGGLAEMWLGTNSSPASRIGICRLTWTTPYRKWPHINQAASQTVALKAGKQYYFEIQQRQPHGSTQLNVHWQLPDGTQERPVPAYRFTLPGN